MFLAVNFNMLLASLLLVLTVSNEVNAAPTTSKKRSPGMVTIPIRSLHNDVRRSDIHPLILVGQHINRSHRRLARMTGRQEPSVHEMRASLQRRVDSVHLGHAASPSVHTKRYVILDGPAKNAGQLNSAGRFDVSRVAKAGSLAAAEAAPAAAAPAAGQPAAAAAPAAGQPAAAAPAAGQPAAAAPAAGQPAAAAAPAANGTAGAGVSPITIAAAQNGGLTKSIAPTASQSVGLDIEASDVGYIGDVTIGTPPRTFKLLMDSGSADFWVGGEACQSQAGGGCGNHTFLGTKSSSTFKAGTTDFQVTYGTGQVAGTVIQDNVSIGGIALNAHTFGVASTESVDFSANTVPFDGLVGLAKSSLSQQKTPTPIESMFAANSVAGPITSFKISRVADQKNDGEMTLGGVDSNKFDTSTVVTLPNVNALGFWEAPMVAQVNGKSVGLDTGRTAILDTGTTLIVAPAADAAAIHQAIAGSKNDPNNGFTVPCTMTETVSMTFGNTSFAINPRDIGFLPVTNNPTGDCISGIQAGQIGGAQEWLVGDVFLKNVYFSTNVQTNTVSLAKLK